MLFLFFICYLNKRSYSDRNAVFEEKGGAREGD